MPDTHTQTMPRCSIRNASVLAYANGFTLWHYKALMDTLATVCGPDYFLDAADMLGVGDMILISASDGAKIVSVSRTDTDAVVVSALV